MNSLRKKMLLSLTLAAAMLLTTITSAAAAPKDKPKDLQPPKSSIQSYVEAMQPGWNLGNTLDATGEDETSWGNPRVTKEQIKAVKANGFNSIRIPVTWDQRMGQGPDYAIDPAFMDRVEEVVDWSLDEGLYVMINLHHDSWLWVSKMEKNPAEVKARYNAAWTQIADRFKNHSNKLMFESINEPRFTDGWGAEDPSHLRYLDELNTSFYNIVRKSGGSNDVRPLVIPTLETNAAQEKLDHLHDYIKNLNDPNLIATIHYYGFWPFSVNIAGVTTFNEETIKDIDDTFDRTYDTLVADGIPVILGEFGLLGFDKHTGVIEQGEKLKFFEYILNYVQQRKIAHMIWDNGQHLNRNTLAWSDPELYEMMKASWKGRSATAKSDLIFVNKGAQVQDAVIPMEMNGNRLVNIWVGDKGKNKLRAGADYTLYRDVLTIKASALARLTASGGYGEQAVLQADFNQGADWNFRVILNDTPKLEAATGTAADFVIPTQFNGDLLATMEAVYEDGSNAGPQNWTSFKEFAYTFSPDVEAGTIQLTENFFKEVNDGVVNLKFHFWSGEILSYTITKDGNSITGMAK
ncbi:cellulase family glycosylhydrolase [Paenibacillus lemnae]|uniref:Cellulase family glycosylhydrolase n=1 Tax=Paenibacillus lemnae TaxID=1330551 RepID=A0A848M915_PAELE|nr:cellulase family glycosylhydrolase [Paenibacillus lemnae]NMO97155.1 cellulase family glycosylhydrolase [Paenibacillus lemnae]